MKQAVFLTRKEEKTVKVSQKESGYKKYREFAIYTLYNKATEVAKEYNRISL